VRSAPKEPSCWRAAASAAGAALARSGASATCWAARAAAAVREEVA
jgi:hypothetical protein